ncbi:hypothetical protein RRG08_027095 [Elysia crispata]|uniref:Uncharacterized protein n=1 Tax=Elysia crispata TaxID=231223 RepID=A0AAE0YTC6_9GAST|nr:hypothetical protein RRG08_027095 [Elysia crispata]
MKWKKGEMSKRRAVTIAESPASEVLCPPSLGSSVYFTGISGALLPVSAAVTANDRKAPDEAYGKKSLRTKVLYIPHLNQIPISSKRQLDFFAHTTRVCWFLSLSHPCMNPIRPAAQTKALRGMQSTYGDQRILPDLNSFREGELDVAAVRARSVGGDTGLTLY